MQLYACNLTVITFSLFYCIAGSLRQDDVKFPALIFSIRNQILASSQGNVTILFSSPNIINCLCVYSATKNYDIYFSTIDGLEIYRATYNNQAAKWAILTVITSSSGFIESLDIDPKNKRLYWHDSRFKLISSSDLDGKRQAFVVATVHNAARIRIDSQNRYLLWKEENRTNEFIKRSTLDGGESVTVVQHALQSNGLVYSIDPQQHILLYTFNQSIYSSHFNGSLIGQQVDLNGAAISSLLYFNQVYYWSTGSSLYAHSVELNETTVIADQRPNFPVNHLRLLHENQGNFDDGCKQQNGGCSHICTTLPSGIPKCICPYGFTMSADHKDCIEIGKSKVAVVLDSKNLMLCSIQANHPTRYVLPPVDFLSFAGDVIIDMFNESIYWTSSHSQEIYISKSDMHFRSLLKIGHIKPTSIAIDKSTGNIYLASLNAEISHGKYGAAISMCTNKGSSFMNIIVRELNKPTHIVLDPQTGRMYFVDTHNHMTFIKSSKMDGTSITVFHKTPNVISALEVDKVNGVLYWAEQASNQSSHHIIIQSRAKFGKMNRHWMTGKVERVNALLIASSKLMAFVKTSNGNEVVELCLQYNCTKSFNIVPDAALLFKNHTSSSSACSQSKCSGMCIPTGQSNYTCPPITGMSNFIFFTKYSHAASISGFSLSDLKGRTVAFPVGMHASWIAHSAYCYSTDRLFWVDAVSESIISARRDNTDVQVLQKGLSAVGGLALDYLAGNIYWSETDKSTISIMSTEGKFSKQLINKIIENPTLVGVDPNLGFLYWVESRKHRNYMIKRSSLSGKNIIQVIMGVGQVTALQVDSYTSDLYWTSTNGDNSQLSLFQPHTFDVKQTAFKHGRFAPSSLTFDKEFLYWTDRQHRSGSVLRLLKWQAFQNNTLELDGNVMADGTDQSSSNGIQVLAYDLGQSLTSLNYFSSSSQKGENICSYNNGGCQQLCLYDGNNTASCQCSMSALASDQHSCIAYTNYLVYSHANKLHTVNVQNDNDDDDDGHTHGQFMQQLSTANGSGKYNPSTMLFNPHFSGFIFSDSLHKSSVFLLVNNTVMSLIDVGKSVIEGIYVSSGSSPLLVWTQTQPSAVGYVQYDHVHKEWTKSIHVVKLRHQRPSAVVMDECTRAIYWVKTYKGVDAINKMQLGTTKIQVLKYSNMSISSLNIDNANRQLLWAQYDDWGRDDMQIYSYHLDMANTQLLYSGGTYEAHSMVRTDNMLYWADWLKDAIVQLDLNHLNASIVVKGVRKVSALTFVTEERANNCSMLEVKQVKIEETSTVVPVDNMHKESSRASSVNLDILMISLPGIMLATIFLSLVIIVLIRKYACCASNKARISYLSYNDSLPRSLCCSGRNAFTDPSDQPSSCIYHMEMEYVNHQFSKCMHDDKEMLIHS